MQSQLQANCACTNLNLLLRLALCGDDHTPVSPGFRVLHTGAGVGRKAASRHVQHVLVVVVEEEVGQEGEAEVVEEEAEGLEAEVLEEEEEVQGAEALEEEGRAEEPQILNVLPRVVHALMKRQAAYFPSLQLQSDS